MKEKALEFLDALTAIIDHRFVGLMVWCGIVACAALDYKWATVTGAVLMAVKQYCSGNWERKGNGNGKHETTITNHPAGGAPAPGS
jgi:hypothetical protein